MPLRTELERNCLKLTFPPKDLLPRLDVLLARDGDDFVVATGLWCHAAPTRLTERMRCGDFGDALRGFLELVWTETAVRDLEPAVSEEHDLDGGRYRVWHNPDGADGPEWVFQDGPESYPEEAAKLMNLLEAVEEFLNEHKREAERAEHGRWSP